MDTRTYDGRLATFKTWPADHPVRPESLAAAGQYYTGCADETRCCVCNKNLERWQPGDDPVKEHADNYPDCQISKNPTLPIQPTENLSDHSTLASKHKEDLGGAGRKRISRSSTASYSSLIQRQRTYDQGWPPALKGCLLEQNLSLAGFIFTGTEDRTRCYSCGIELDEWAVDDIPYYLHLKNNTDCRFIQAMKQEIEKFHGPGYQLPQMDKPPTYPTMPFVPPAKQEQKRINLPSKKSSCIVCDDAVREILFEPCSHFVVCEDCSAKCTHCPACGSIIIKKSRYVPPSKSKAT